MTLPDPMGETLISFPRSRALAETACILCGQPIGKTRAFWYKTTTPQHVRHASCHLEDSADAPAGPPKPSGAPPT